jgi:iron complex transport system permease protein
MFGGFAALRIKGLPVVGLAFLLLGLILLGIGDGAVGISPGQILSILAGKLGVDLPIPYQPQQESVLWAIRFPRVILGVLVGISLAVSGTLLQGLFRNPLAEPNLLGISSGAALFAVITIVLGERIASGFVTEYRVYALPFAAFCGGICTIFLVYRIGKSRGSVDTATILLAGIALNALAGAGIGLLTFLADDTQLRNITFWLLGSLGAATWQSLSVIAPLIILPLFWLRNLSRQMNALLLGDAEAGHLGIDVNKLKRKIILIVAVTVGASVSVTGIIGFVGLVVPHLLRLTIGADHRNLLPASALLGAALLVGADWLSRTIVSPAELPIGVITAAVGSPFFLWLLLRKNNDY